MKYRVTAAGKKAELYLYDYIGEWLGGVSAKQVVEDVKALGRVDVINVRVNSPGGDVFDGITIYNILKSHPARIEVDVDGLCASIASIVAMAGDEIRMASNAMLMIHNPMSIAVGSADEMRKKADYMDQVKENMVATYAGKTGLDPVRISQLMDEETWMQASDAMQEGFVDAVTEELKMAACFDLSRFKHPPRLDASAPLANPFRARLAANAERVRKVCGVSPQ